MLLQLIGLDSMSQTTLMVFAVAVAMGASLAGWLTDSIMGPKGYGVIGNTVLILVGVCSGLATTRRFLGPMEMAQASTVVTITSGCAMAMLMLFAAVKQVLR